MLHEPNIGAVYVVNYNMVILGLFDYAFHLVYIDVTILFSVDGC